MQGNEELKKRQILSAQIDLSKFNKGDFIKATEEEKKQQDVMGESTTFFKDGMKRLKKNPLAMGSIVILVLILALIIIAPFFVPYSYSDTAHSRSAISSSQTAISSILLTFFLSSYYIGNFYFSIK